MAARPEEVSDGPRPGGTGVPPAGSARQASRLPHGLAGVAVLALLLSAGCTALDPFVSGGNGPPAGAVYQVVATWNNQVAYAPDPAHGGAPTPGLAGRMYLFGPQIDFPLQGDGSVVVDLYDETGDKPVMLEEWRFDHDTLRRLLREDMIGWGYTLFLPWGTYKADVKRVRLRLCYQPASGSPLYAENAPMTLNGADTPGQAAAAGPKPAAAASAAAPGPAVGQAPLQTARFPVGR
jgi:hypothetical protein